VAHQAPTPSEGSKNPAIIKNDKLYDAIKFYALVVLPAIGTLYFAFSQIWGLPHGAEVVGSITAVDTFLGGLLHISNQQYQNSDAANDGTMNITDTPEKTIYDLKLNGLPEDMANQKTVTFKVNKQ